MFPLTKHEQRTISFVPLGSTATRHHFRSCAGADTFARAGHGCTHRLAATGHLNTNTDVAGVLVGQTNIVTGVTAILPHGQSVPGEGPGNGLCRQCVWQPAGSTQVKPLG
jgi:hypothetical protein